MENVIINYNKIFSQNTTEPSKKCVNKWVKRNFSNARNALLCFKLK